ncbi:hypothetical protein F8388_025217 [Cannabis sativa]|uniref:U-box domain-containing protein n=1 Tax=Cannabis sativa TaxID=3483 RepID=A0A7J6FS23_CANSA|nr:hypothetical protein F8388_025217 [Cannabis sativa]
MVLGWRLRRKSNKKKSLKAMKVEIPNHFLCPISFDLMKDPVTLSTGITYDRENIEKWLEEGNFTCPVTNQILHNFDMIPNHSIRKMIQEWGLENQKHGFQRIPTPRIPITPIEVTNILSFIESSSRQLDTSSCLEALKKIKQWGTESHHRNKRCMVANGAAEVLSAAFKSFATEPFEENSIVCEEILSNLAWMFPIGKIARNHLKSEASLRCMIQFLTRVETNISTKENSIKTLEELIIFYDVEDDQNQTYTLLEFLSKIEGVNEILMEFIQNKVSNKITKSTLMIIYQMVSTTPSLEITILSFLEMGLISSLLEILVDSHDDQENNKVIISERALGIMDSVLSYYQGRVKAYENDLTIPILVKKLLRVSNLATEFSVSSIWKLCMNGVVEQEKEELRSVVLVETLQVGGFQKLLLIIQVGCGYETKEKATEVLKLLNPYRPQLECIESIDYKSLQRFCFN